MLLLAAAPARGGVHRRQRAGVCGQRRRGLHRAGHGRRLQELEGIGCALGRDEASARFELPADRLGDLVAIAERGWVIGTSPDRHDLSGLDAPLRSHGGLSERTVPLLLNRPTPDLETDRALNNYDILDVALNHAA
jgi:phosphonoacetate hydrolase